MENVRLHLKSGSAEAEPSSSQPGATVPHEAINSSGSSTSSCSITIAHGESSTNDRSLPIDYNAHNVIYNDPLWFTTAIETIDVDNGTSKFFDTNDSLLCDIASPDKGLAFDLTDFNNFQNQDWDWLKQLGFPGPEGQAGVADTAHSNPIDRHCDECDKDFKFPKDYRRHVASVHSDERPLKCPVDRCKYAHKGFAREDNRKRHIEKMHPGVASTTDVVYDL